MKVNQRFFVILILMILLTASLVSTALAADTRVVKFASVTKVKVLDDQPATFRLLGDYTCDRVQVETHVSGKTIYINIWDVKIKHTGQGCDKQQSYKRIVNVGNLVPGIYTVLVNVDENGQAARKIKNFVAPLIPVATPAVTQP